MIYLLKCLFVPASILHFANWAASVEQESSNTEKYFLISVLTWNTFSNTQKVAQSQIV